MRLLPSLLALALAGPALSTPLHAQDWPHWRGPTFDGSTPASVPKWKVTPEDGVRWSTPLPGPGAATPIVVEGRVFATSVDPEAGKLLAMCFDAATGEERWVDEAGSGYRAGDKGDAIGHDQRSNYASPSPVSDGERVAFLFGNGDLVTYDLDGKRLWAKNLQKEYGDFAFQWTFSASPTLWNGVLYLPVLQRDQPANGIGKDGAESYLLALDAASGKEKFRHVRPSDAVMESRESYATPIPYTGADGRAELLVVGGDVITGHAPDTGAELWRWGTWNDGHREEWWRLVPSPVVGAGVVLACGPKGAPVCAVVLGQSGTLADEKALWKSEGRRDPITTDVPTPLFFDGAFFVLSDLRNALTRVYPKTGAAAWSVELPREHLWRASPTGADGKVWLLDHGGNLRVLDAKSGETLHTAAFGDPDEDAVQASVAIAGGHLFLRTSTALLCLGE